MHYSAGMPALLSSDSIFNARDLHCYMYAGRAEEGYKKVGVRLWDDWVGTRMACAHSSQPDALDSD